MKANKEVKFKRVAHPGYDSSYVTEDGNYEIIKVYYGLSSGYKVIKFDALQPTIYNTLSGAKDAVRGFIARSFN